MAANNFVRSLTAVLKHEGGYVDHARDPGGATNMGITIGTLRASRRTSVTKIDVRNLTKDEAGEIYRKKYWHKVRADEMPSGLDYALFDFAVNSGPSRAVKFLQHSVGVTEDGEIGPFTMRAIRDYKPSVIINSICDRRLAWLKRLRTWGTFGRGWMRRVNGVKRLAHTMATEVPPAIILPPKANPPPPDIGGISRPVSSGSLSQFWRWLRRVLIGV